MLRLFRLPLLGLIFLFLLSSVSSVYAASIGVERKAKVLNTTNSYLDFTQYASNVTVDNSTGNFSGYAFLEDMGWVAFGTEDNNDGPVSVSLTTGAVSGKAEVINTGAFLDFTNYNSNVEVNLNTGVFSGYVFSEDVGWIDFTDTGVTTASPLVTPTPTPGSSSSDSSSGNETSDSSACTASPPGGSVPNLYAALPQGNGAIELYFTDASDPYTHYALEYGTSSGSYQFGSTDIGGKGARTYNVGSLLPNTMYYFRVRAMNDCAGGEWSEEISATTTSLVSLNQLEFTQSELTPSQPEKTDTANTCSVYTVKPGDSLWDIAQNELGDGELFLQIKQQNSSTYLSLQTSNNLTVGWELSLNCNDETTPDKEREENEEGEEEKTEDSEGYDVNVHVEDTGGNPVTGAQVTLHSTPRTATTDERGIATFADVERGQHRVVIAYEGYEGEQAISLTGDSEEFDLNITVEPKAVTFSTPALIIIGILLVTVIALSILLFRKRSHSSSN